MKLASGVIQTFLLEKTQQYGESHALGVSGGP
jgi:hypothetical protein